MAWEPQFIKSVLPVEETLLSPDATDTSLAVPTEDKITTSRSLLTERNLRVQQQVRHTLARKGRTSTYSSLHAGGNSSLSSSYGMENGYSLQLKKADPGEYSKDFGSLFSHLKHSHTLGRMVTYDGGNTFSWKAGVRGPLQRVEVSPDSSPELSRAPLGLRTKCHTRGSSWTNGCLTLPTAPPPVTAQSPRTLSQSSRRYARSEVVRGTRWYDSLPSAANRPAHQPISQPRPAPQRGDLLSHSTPCRTAEARRGVGSSYAARRQAGAQAGAQPGAQPGAQAGAQAGVGGQDGGSLAWLSRVRRESHLSDALKKASYPASLVSMELDAGSRRAAGGHQAQQIAGTDRTAEGQGTVMTVEKAISLLTQDNVEMQVSAASFLQHQCFNSADAKRKVSYLQGIQKLISLLQSESEELQQAVAGALRNVVFENNQNKMEVRDLEGVPAILALLRTSRDVETRRQLTGLLWNLSSHDQLKEYLLRQALKTLTESVVVPCSGITEGENPKEDLLADTEVFYNATGCLRNLSSAGPDGRRTMRESAGFIDALVYYTRGTIADYKPDDKSTENCVCILHNLSYQLEAELPQKFMAELQEPRRAVVLKTRTPGCFPVRSVEIDEPLERHCPLLEDKSNPSGVEWLWSSIITRMYLSLIARSSRCCTQEASVGALQNLTAGNAAVAEWLSHTIVRREGGLSQLKAVLREGHMDVKKPTVSLLRNLSRFRDLHGDIIKQVLPELVAMLPNTDSSADLPTDLTVSLCHILINLCQADAQSVRAVVNHGALPKVIAISSRDNGYGPTRAAQAACFLLHTMWNQSELRGAYKKAGYRKSDFISGRTLKTAPMRD